MPNRKNNYSDMEKYSKTRVAQNKRYYAKTAHYEPKNWTIEEDNLVLEHSVTDSQLSKMIQRSVRAIQIQRSRLKSKIETD